MPYNSDFIFVWFLVFTSNAFLPLYLSMFFELNTSKSLYGLILINTDPIDVCRVVNNTKQCNKTTYINDAVGVALLDVRYDFPFRHPSQGDHIISTNLISFSFEHPLSYNSANYEKE